MTRMSDLVMRSPLVPRLGGSLFGRLLPEFDRLFTEWTRPDFWTEGTGGWYPAAEISETDKQYKVTVELPGIDIKGLNISFANSVLTISGEKAKMTDEGENLYCSEIYSGSFRRSFEIPGAVDEEHIDATYHDGILKVVLTKTKESRIKKIAVHQ